jgi:hypothetical protein
MKSNFYNFGIPGYVIWMTHVLIGLLLIYVGYQTLYKQPINDKISILLIVMGSLAITYHLHLWIFHSKK